MSRSVRAEEDEIEIKYGNTIVAHFEDNGNGLGGHVDELYNYPLEADEIIALAQFLLNKASDRARKAQRR